ncbi:MAG: hypothetical protein RIS35_3510 [Pseudomonadota bacterium]
MKSPEIRRPQIVDISWSVIIAFMSVAFYLTAWITEDAFITFRVIDNFVGGLGPVWNPGERVQVYTHPLWFGILLPLVALSGEPYFTSLAASLVLLLVSLMIVRRMIVRPSVMSMLVIASLVLSRAFVDYASSGLEIPLLYALLSGYVLVWIGTEGLRRTRWLFLLASAVFLTRPDAVLLIAPSLAVELWRGRSARGITRSAAIGILPAIAWVTFSLVYYGSPVPNTALAKLSTGFGAERKFLQAWAYLTRAAASDPHTLALIVIGCIVPLTLQVRSLRSLCAGILLWIAYLFLAGGDHMAGRFLSFPAFLSAILLAIAWQGQPGRAAHWLLAAMLATNAAATARVWQSESDYEETGIDAAGIADERRYFYNALGLRPTLERGGLADNPWIQEGGIARAMPGLYVRCTIGMAPYFAGPAVRWIDPLALSQPFLARLPAREVSRIGHYERAFPEGFLESEALGINAITDPGLSALYADVVLATRAPLGDARRIAAVWRLNTRGHSQTIRDHARNGPLIPGHLDGREQSGACLDASREFGLAWRVTSNPVAIHPLLR